MKKLLKNKKNLIGIFSIIFILIFVLFNTLSESEDFYKIPIYCSKIKKDISYPFSCIIFGDNRPKNPIKFWLKDPIKQRKEIAKKLSEEKVDFFINVGDIVIKGSSKKDWHTFDTLYSFLYKKKIPFFPCLGNHEYYGRNKKALFNYFSRFPDLLNNKWYKFKVKNILFIILDSNIKELSKKERKKQENWLKSSLEDAHINSNIKLIIIFTHHPPYVNSSYYKKNRWIRKKVLPLLTKYKKVKLFISGHIHTYEHFYINNIHFIITGGGGAPLHSISETPIYSYKDLYKGKRNHHYCKITFYKNYLKFEVYMLNDSFKWKIVDSFKISY